MQALPLPTVFLLIFVGFWSSFGNAVGQGADGADTVAGLYFPEPQEPWETVDAQHAGWDKTKIEALVDWVGARGSTSILILWQGRILAEKHWGDGQTAPTRRYQRMFVKLNERQQAIEDVASVQKSIVSILVGIAVHKKLLRIEDPVSNHLAVG